MPWIVVNGMAHELGEGETIVGNGAQARWRVPALDLMPKHFILWHAGREVSIRPCSRDSIVALNGVQLPSKGQTLADGDTIDAGSGRFHFWTEQPRLKSQADASVVARGNPAYLLDDAERVAYPLTRLSSGIGRDPSNVVIARDATVSRFQAEVRREAGGFALHGLGNEGTQLNDRLIDEPCLLAEGDRVAIGAAVFRFSRTAVPNGFTLVTSPARGDESATRVPTVRNPSVSRRLREEEVGLDLEGGAAGGRPRTLVIVAAVLVVLVVAWWFLH